MDSEPVEATEAQSTLELDHLKERMMLSFIRAGKSVSITISSDKRDLLVEKLGKLITEAGAPEPRIIDLGLQSLQSDIKGVEKKAMDFLGLPNEYKSKNPEYNIWLNPDQIIKTGLPTAFRRVSKYARNIFIFDHTYEFDQLPEELKYALGAECDATFKFAS